ncbi:hypothetical protein J7E49_10325 [Variovorax paradoxus]|nr:hypothetical protein [Variovorax paradoxus]
MKIETLTSTGQVIDGARCLVSNERNDASVRSGQTLPIRRSGANLDIECNHPGQPPATGQAISRANVGMAGNLLIGGVVGAVIDSGTGAGFNYPSWIRMVFGEARSFDRSAQTGDGPTAGIKIGTNELAAAPAAPAPAPAPIPAPAPAASVAVAAPSAALVRAPSLIRPGGHVSMDDLGALLPARP